MDHDTKQMDASREYAAAYAAHYTARDLPLAIRLYKELMESHADSQEAAYSWNQVQNIVNVVVPKQELLNAHMDLVLLQFEHYGDTDAEQSHVAPLAVGMN